MVRELELQHNTIIPLSWDSKFFGYNVAQITFNEEGIIILDALLDEIKFKRVRLTYLFISPSYTELNSEIVEQGGILVDQKTLYSKVPQLHNEIRNNIVEYNEEKPDESLLNLGLQAGQYSRFRTDSNFVNNEYERLYTQWLVNSVNKSIAFKVLIAVNGNDIIGLTTLGEKGNNADIGLVAVDKIYSGRGVGTDLIHSAENIAFEMGFNAIKVVT